MNDIGQVGQCLQWIGAVAVQRFELRQNRGRIACEQDLQQVEDAAAVGKTEHGPHRLRADLAGAHRDRLIENRQAIAYRAFGSARDQTQCVVFRGRVLVGANAREVGDELGNIDAAQIETLAAR